MRPLLNIVDILSYTNCCAISSQQAMKKIIEKKRQGNLTFFRALPPQRLYCFSPSEARRNGSEVLQLFPSRLQPICPRLVVKISSKLKKK